MVLGLGQKVREMPGPNLKGVLPTVHPFATVSLKGKRHDKITLSPRSQAREHRRRLLTRLLLSQDAAADDATGRYGGDTGVLHHRSSSTFTSNGSAALRSRREGGREAVLQGEDAAGCKPCYFPCLCCPASVQRDKFPGPGDFPFGDGAINKQTRGSLLGASFAPPGIGSVASMLQIATQGVLLALRSAESQGKGINGRSCPGNTVPPGWRSVILA